MKALPALVFAIFLASPLAAQTTSAPALKGEVIETQDADIYTYLHLKTKQGDMWAAVQKAPVKKGAQVTIENPMLMTDFESKTLNRKFDKIVFGTLAGVGGTAAAGASPHGSAPQPADGPVEKVAKATGPDARTVAEVWAQKAQLKGKTVSVRGKVVKSAENIMGKNWLHLRDGSGVGADGTNDLVVMTAQAAKVGEVVTARGVVNTDADIGMGVKYKVLIEDAKLQK